MIDQSMVALGISPEGRPVPIQLTAAGLLAVSGGSSGVGSGAFVGGYVLIGIAPDGTRVPISVNSNGVIQTSGSSSTGTVTSVDISVPATLLTVSGGPVTTSGTLALALATQAANTVFAGPTSGGVVVPTFRALVGADLPATITKATTFNIAGAASAPALSVTGVPFAGTGTTSFPQLYINDSAATASTTLNTTGTSFGVNAHGSSMLANFMLDGVAKLQIGNAGNLIFAVSGTNTYIHPRTTNTLQIIIAGTAIVEFGSSAGYGIQLNSTSPIAWSSTSAGGTTDLTVQRLTAASLQLGAAASATPVAYTLTVGESSRSGTDTNTAGASGTIRPGAGTGTGATVPLILMAPIQVASGTGAQTQTEWARGQAVGTAIGASFFGVAAVVRQTVGANVNNIAASGTTGQFDDFTNLSVYATDAAAIHASIYQLARSVTQLTTAVRNYGLGV